MGIGRWGRERSRQIEGWTARPEVGSFIIIIIIIWIPGFWFIGYGLGVLFV
jgi:hypothetical protein